MNNIKLNVKGLQNGESITFSEDFLVEIPSCYGVSENFKTANVSFSGSAKQSKQGITLNASLKAVLNLCCMRCLTDFVLDIDENFTEKFVSSDSFLKNQSDEPLNSFQYSGDLIDLSECVNSNLLLNIPVKVLCCEECKGLCPTCFASLNDGACTCAHSTF